MLVRRVYKSIILPSDEIAKFWWVVLPKWPVALSPCCGSKLWLTTNLLQHILHHQMKSTIISIYLSYISIRKSTIVDES